MPSAFRRLEALAARSECAVCGGRLVVAFVEQRLRIRCVGDIKHLGTRPLPSLRDLWLAGEPVGIHVANRLEKKMSEQEKSLVRYTGIATVSEDEAEKMLTTLFNGAPIEEIKRAAVLCRQYGLNPLMKHIFLVKYDGKKGVSWSIQLAIKASRLIVSNNLRRQRLPNYGYVEDTPRLMTEDEEVRVFRTIDPKAIRAITVLDWQGQKYRGYGSFPRDAGVMGADKGNSPENMAMIRSERAALDRIDPGALPADLPTVDERYVESTARPLPDKALPPGPSTAEKTPRDPATLKNFGDLWAAVKEDFGLDRSHALQKLGFQNQDDVSGAIPDLYLQIAATV